MVEAIRQGDIPGVQLRRRQLIAEARPETVWAWLTEPSRLQQWLCEEATVAPGPAGGLLLGRGESRERGETRELEHPRRWVLDFREEGWERSTRLTFELLDHIEGTELIVLQEGFQALPLSDCLTLWERYRKRWEEALARLAVVSTSKPS